MSPSDKKTLAERIEAKLDRILANQQAQAVEIARHDVRIGVVEKTQEKSGGKVWTVISMMLSAIIGGASAHFWKS